MEKREIEERILRAVRLWAKVYQLSPKELAVKNSEQPANTLNGVTFDQLMRSLNDGI